MACDKPSDNKAPTISFSAPANNSSFMPGEIITFSVEVDDPEEDIKEVRFYADDIELGSDQDEPYSFDWETDSIEFGEYTIKAEAVDNDGAVGDAEIAITFEYITVTDIDGNVYGTVIIGTQVWMVENLKVTHYRDGTAITNVTDEAEWGALSTEAYCIYNNNASNEGDIYGSLYNWFAVADSRNIAPEGWHVPTDDEWKELEMALGMSQSEADDSGYRGTNEGSKLAGNADLWTDGSMENDSEFGASGFTALPGGYRHYGNGSFDTIGNHAYFWSAPETDSNYATYRKLKYSNSAIHRGSPAKNYGFSIRLCRDQTILPYEIGDTNWDAVCFSIP